MHCIEVNDGRAITIMDVLRKLCSDNALDLEHKLVAFGSNGALIGSK